MSVPEEQTDPPLYAVRWVFVGQRVYVHVCGGWAKCKVVCAAGDAARIVNATRKINVWVTLHDLRTVDDL